MTAKIEKRTEFSMEEIEKSMAIYPEIKDIKSEVGIGDARATDLIRLREKIGDVMGSIMARLSEEVAINYGFPQEDFNEITTVGLITYYPYDGEHVVTYLNSIAGLNSISPFSVIQYRLGGDYPINLKLDNSFDIYDDPNEEYFVVPSFPLTFQDALEDNKLFVMKDELQKFLSQVTQDNAEVNPIIKPAAENTTNEKLTGKVQKSLKGTRASTLERYADWQRRADEKKAKNPALSTYAIAESIHTDLTKEKSKYLRSVDAIRQNITI